MKKYGPIIVIIILIVLGSGVVFLLKDQNGPDPMTPPIQGTQLVTAQLALEPMQPTVTNGQEAMYSVILTADALSVIGVESHMNYDPNVITVLAIEPAGLFTEPKVLSNSIDTTQGTIIYAVGSFSPAMAQGNVFTVRIRANAPINSVPFTFDRSRTKVALVDPVNQKNYTQDEIQLDMVEKPLTVLP